MLTGWLWRGDGGGFGCGGEGCFDLLDLGQVKRGSQSLCDI